MRIAFSMAMDEPKMHIKNVLNASIGDAQRGIAHATSGPCLQHNLVTVLEGV